MRSIRPLRPLLAALTVLALFASSAFALNSVLNHKNVKWREIGILAARDTTFMTDEADTTRTEWISTADWDWEAMAQFGSTGTGWTGAAVTFYAQDGVNNGVTDTLTFTVERGIKRLDTGAAADSVIAVGNFTMVGTTGSIATCPLPASPFVNAWWGPLICDPDTKSDHNIWFAEYIRLRVAGDQSGTTPKISKLRCRISYLKKQ